jgi:hypothetical protein
MASQQSRSDLGSVPVVDVHEGNIQVLLPGILMAIKASSFVSVDVELSGIGPQQQLRAPSLDDRYLAIKNVRTYNIFSYVVPSLRSYVSVCMSVYLSQCACFHLSLKCIVMVGHCAVARKHQSDAFHGVSQV